MYMYKCINVMYLVGRPYGGTAILFRKELAACITTVDVNDPRLCVIKFD
jgi:hypothetical protein